MGWKQVELSWDDIGANKQAHLQNAFFAIFLAFDAPPEAAMYGSHDPREPHYYYFTPRAVKIARPLLDHYGAVDCDPPNTLELAVLVRRE